MGIVGLIFNGCSSREKKRKEKPGIEKKKPKRKKAPINWTAAGRGEGWAHKGYKHWVNNTSERDKLEKEINFFYWEGKSTQNPEKWSDNGMKDKSRKRRARRKRCTSVYCQRVFVMGNEKERNNAKVEKDNDERNRQLIFNLTAA